MKNFPKIAHSLLMVEARHFLRYNLRLHLFPFDCLVFLRPNSFVALQNHPKYSSVAPTPENPQLPANPDELPSASSRHDLDADEESLEGGDAESSSTSQRNREGRTKKAMDIDAPDVLEGDGDSTSPAATSPKALDTHPASSESGALVNSLGVPYVLS